MQRHSQGPYQEDHVISISKDSPVGRRELDVNIIIDSSMQRSSDRQMVQNFRNKPGANNSELETMNPYMNANNNNSPDLVPFKADMDNQSA